MFWKKDNKNQEIFTYESTDRRAYYRIAPSTAEPIIIEFGDQKVHVADIGAGGLSFKNKHFKKGESHKIKLSLPHPKVSIPMILKIIAIDQQEICHCHFAKLAKNGIEAIHQYVLERQKEMAQLKKAACNKEQT